MIENIEYPRQTLPAKSKGEKWRRSCVDWASNHTCFSDPAVRRDVVRMKINYDLLNGVIHMEDLAAILNPGNLSTLFLPDKIQHYPIINSKINTLRGEEAARAFDWRVIVTNPYAVSQIEEEKKRQFDDAVKQIVENPDLNDEQAGQQAQETSQFFDYTWQDLRELRANELLKHYSKEQNFRQKFNDGFVDAATCSVEAYQCGIVGGEPVLVRLNPIKLRIYQNGYSNHIEDADIIIYEDYWSPGRIVDTYYDELSPKDVKWLSDEVPMNGRYGTPIGAAGNYDEAFQFNTGTTIMGEEGVVFEDPTDIGYGFNGFSSVMAGVGSSILPYDTAGNVRVLHVWWKSKRKIQMVESFDPMTGEKNYDFYPETYIADEDAGEKATALWINEAWEGTKIGEDIYVGIRPCLVQHNSLSNPSKCHFGIVGTIYNVNESLPYSLVDMMKPYNYMYDAIHAKLVDLIATNWGKILEMDLALKPKNWKVEKWMYFARANKVLIKDSFNEGNVGAATGKLAGGLNNATKGYIDADWGNSIQNYINLLQWTKDSMSDLVGINRQREGNTYSRETVGGIERAVLQSSYITDWLFQQHDDTKQRVLTAFLDECKGALRGRSKKFQYILSDGTRKIMEVPGDEFCECDYGVIVDNSDDTKKFNAQIDSIAQAAAQNSYHVSTLIKLYSSASIQEKIRMIERDEKQMQQQQEQAQQQQFQLEQQKIQAEQQMLATKMQQEDLLNQRDNQTKIDVAEINSRAEYLRLGIYEEQNNEEILREKLQIERDKLAEDIRQFDAELRQKDDELKVKKEIEMKKIAANNNKKK